jgi:hypothetical protein
MRGVISNWTNSKTRDLRPSGNMLSISCDASCCGVVMVTLLRTSSKERPGRTSLSIASKNV